MTDPYPEKQTFALVATVAGIAALCFDDLWMLVWVGGAAFTLVIVVYFVATRRCCMAIDDDVIVLASRLQKLKGKRAPPHYIHKLLDDWLCTESLR